LVKFRSIVGITDAILKTIAFGLGVGVLADAFIVRMTLVPAVLAATRPQIVVAAKLAGPSSSEHRHRAVRRAVGPSADLPS
jgi:uncharacterized membrane protein YdfJ with MMPL/SSD domain